MFILEEGIQKRYRGQTTHVDGDCAASSKEFHHSDSIFCFVTSQGK